MSTDTIGEDREVATTGFVFSRRLTATSSGDEDDSQALATVHHPLGTSDFWGVVSHGIASLGRDDDLEVALANFAQGVLGVPEVIAVSHAKERHANLVWTFIERRDKVVRRKIYATERALMARFQGLVFDFNVVALDQSAPGTFLPDDLQGRLIVYRPKE